MEKDLRVCGGSWIGGAMCIDVKIKRNIPPLYCGVVVDRGQRPGQSDRYDEIETAFFGWKIRGAFNFNRGNNHAHTPVV